MSDWYVRCAKSACNYKHNESERVHVEGQYIGQIKTFDLVCPKCGCKSFYKVKEQPAQQRAREGEAL